MTASSAGPGMYSSMRSAASGGNGASSTAVASATGASSFTWNPPDLLPKPPRYTPARRSCNLLQPYAALYVQFTPPAGRTQTVSGAGTCTSTGGRCEGGGGEPLAGGVYTGLWRC